MKQIFATLIGLLFLSNYSLAQGTDTLKVIVLTPNHVEVSANCRDEYLNFRKETIENRTLLKAEKLKEKEEHLKEYNDQPDYTKKMFDNKLDFYDSLTIDNYVSMIANEYIGYRLHKPFKIKPRLVFIEAKKLNSDLGEYSKLSNGEKNFFIVNFPSVRVFKENNEFKVKTKIELYSNATKEILYTAENIGLMKTEMTDYPMCYNNNWDCAFVNSVYPSLYKILFIIAEKNTYGK
jgi:hypothetical protein